MNNIIFRYKTVKGPLHRASVLLKLFLLLFLSFLCMSLPSLFLAVGIITTAIITTLCKFTLREQLTDLKPALIYAAFMFSLSIITFISENLELILTAHYTLHTAHSYLLPSLQISLRLVLIVQLSALFFRTTSSMEIREGLCLLNKRLGENISLFLSFIPQVFENWNTIDLAWKARGGKNGIKKIKTVVFMVISVSMEKAAIKARALAARKGK